MLLALGLPGRLLAALRSGHGPVSPPFSRGRQPRPLFGWGFSLYACYSRPVNDCPSPTGGGRVPRLSEPCCCAPRLSEPCGISRRLQPPAVAQLGEDLVPQHAL